ncbi:MAG: hypothetical protein WBD87_08810 [Candidatus Acidiferrales bacterium]
MASKSASKTNRHALPLSLEKALDGGWKIQEHLAGWTFTTANKVDGFLMLSHAKDSRTLMVPFVALYELRKPHFL